MIDRNGYNLSVLPTPENMPLWAKDLTAATQVVLDSQYLHGPGGLDNFYGQADSWVQTQTINRANSPDPKSYIPLPFKMAIPRRQVVTYDTDGNMMTAFFDADPSIQLPQLPVWVDAPPSAPGPTFGGTHPPADPAQLITQAMAAVMAKLILIEQLIRSK